VASIQVRVKVRAFGVGFSPVYRVPALLRVGHVALVLSLVLNLGLNINLNQQQEGKHMVKATTVYLSKDGLTKNDGCEHVVGHRKSG
jgi:hypothetical protein